MTNYNAVQFKVGDNAQDLIFNLLKYKQVFIKILVTVGLFGVFVAVLFISKYVSNKDLPQVTTTPTPYSKVVPKLSTESLNKLPTLFPRVFILGKTPEVISATSINPTPTAVKINVKFKDPNNYVQAAVEEYEDYATHTNWIVDETITSSGDFIIELKRGVQRMVVTIEPNKLESGILVNIDYYATIAKQ